MAPSTPRTTTSPDRRADHIGERADARRPGGRTDLGSMFEAAGSDRADGTGAGREASFLDAVRVAADAVCRLAAEPEWSRKRADGLVRLVSERCGVPLRLARTGVCSRALAEPRLQTWPPQLAAEAIVRILAALAPVRGASLWVRTPGKRLTSAVSVGSEPAAGRARAVARAVLADREPGRNASILAVPVRCWERPVGALVLAPGASGRAAAQQLAVEASEALAVVLEREALLGRSQERERLLVEASERRLARLAFDIHDGALQTVAALGLELRLLAGERREGEPALRLATLYEHTTALEEELRELTRSLEPSTIARRPLAATLADHVAAFEAHKGIAARFEARGELTGLTPSQRIALVRVVHEALANARDHGAATEIVVAVRGGRSAIHLDVTDDGCGFDVARTLPAAARKGRLGLVGMSERVRLLGGRLDIDSRVGGPTTISASLPRWKPIAAVVDQGAARPAPAV